MLDELPLIGRKGWPWDEEVSPAIYENVQWPKISIVTPSFNQGKFIEETIRSIVLQNYPNLEYIIIDGGSTDQTVEIIKKYNSKIQYWVSENDEGQSDALIKGFKKASGVILNWINSDDILHPKALFHIAKAFIDNKELGFVHGRNGIISVDSEMIGDMPHPKDLLEIRYLFEMPYGQQACFFKSDIYSEAGGINRNIRFSMDYELYVKMHLTGIKSLQIDDLIGSYRVHPETKTSNLEKVMRYENGNVFTSFLDSVGNKRHADFFRKLGFKDYGTYKVKGSFSKEKIKKAVVMFLKKSIWYYYEENASIACQMVKKLMWLEPKNVTNLHYLKILKDNLKNNKN
jgi:glycosyltransferase involved in cell wall biosynthesis